MYTHIMCIYIYVYILISYISSGDSGSRNQWAPCEIERARNPKF